MNTKTRKHYTFENLPWSASVGYATATVVIRTGETTWNPACTTCKIYGPATVSYVRHSDGSVDARIIDN